MEFSTGLENGSVHILGYGFSLDDRRIPLDQNSHDTNNIPDILSRWSALSNEAKRTRSDQSFLVFVCVVFALVAIGILALRRGSYGRRLRALADSPAASATIGMNLTATKLTVFALSAGLAGLAGALYGQQQGLVGEPDFQLLLSLTLLLLAVVWGIRTMTGVLVAGLIFAFFPVIQSHVSWLRDLTYLGIGRNPNGVFGGNTLMQKRRDKRAAAELQASLTLATADESSEAVSASR